MERRLATGRLPDHPAGALAPPPVRLWQEAVHRPGIYDLGVDTSRLSPAACAALIRQRLAAGPAPAALRELAAWAPA